MLSHLIQWFVRVIITPQLAISKLVLPDVAGVLSSSAQTQMWLFTPELCIPSHHAAAPEMEMFGEKSVVSFSHANIQGTILVFLSSLLFLQDLFFVCLFFVFLLKSLILTLYFHGLTSNS